MSIWRIFLLPKRFNPQGENQFPFCNERGIIGIGWHLPNPDPVPTEVDDYLRCVREMYKLIYSGDWESASTGISRDMQKDDLVWARNHIPYGRLHLGQITGDWKYEKGKEFEDADIVSVRPCKLYDVPDEYYGEDAEEFISMFKKQRFNPGNTIIPITDESEVQRTNKIWDKIKEVHQL